MKKLKINRSIYSDKAIRNAIQAYQYVAAITPKMNEDYAILTFWKCTYDEDQTMKEFENYLIGVENS